MKSKRARYIMIGGFLGAGKSTAVVQLARRLTQQGLRVGLITNDQGAGLVDTAMMRAQGFRVEEIAGGCFCCRFNSLKDASDRLAETDRPDVFIAEPVGSCTDLLATVSYPLRRMYGDDFAVSPLTVVVDPVRALRVLGVEPGRSFSPKVVYVYRKQLEEAEIILLNKADAVEPARMDQLREAIARECPAATLFTCSARTGDGLADWARKITTENSQSRLAMQIDYRIYGEGEAKLGWLNAMLILAAAAPLNGNALLLQLARELRDRLTPRGHEIAHLKMTLAPDDDSGELAVANLVRNDFEPESSHTLLDDLCRGEMIVNLRAEAPPEVLAEALRDAVAACCGTTVPPMLTIGHLEHFQPSQPVPAFRDTECVVSGVQV